MNFCAFDSDYLFTTISAIVMTVLVLVPQSSYWSVTLLQVMGIVRCPLYTLPNGLGFPAFLRQKFIGNSREQLLMTLERRGLLSAEEVQHALETSRTVNNYVTREEINY